MAVLTIPKNSRRALKVVKGRAPERTAPKEMKSLKERVRDLLSQMEESLGEKAKNASVADFIRLTQLERELEQEEQPGKVVVTWRESPEIQDSET